MFRAAVIGCGRIGATEGSYPLGMGVRSHAGGYRHAPSTELVAVCDPDAAALDRCLEAWGHPAGYTAAERLLAEAEPEIVSVCTPDDTHADLVRLALRSASVKAVLVEKPICRDLQEARGLVELAAGRGVVLAVNYSRRFAPVMVRLRDWIDGGGLGSIQAITGLYTRGLFNIGSHWIDLVRCLAGDIVEVAAVDRLHEPGPDPTLDVTLSFASGATGVLCGLDRRHFDAFEMDIFGTRARVRLTRFGDALELRAAADSPRHPGYRELVTFDQQEAGILDDVMLHVVTDVARALERGSAPRCTGEDGVAALSAVLAAHRAVTGGAGTEPGRHGRLATAPRIASEGAT